jgi:addiction module RelE/StbE family toxin
MEAVFTKRFLSDTKKLKKDLRRELEKAVNKILENPLMGKPLKYSFKGCRSARVSKFRIIYKIERDRIIFITFEHRKKAYRS